MSVFAGVRSSKLDTKTCSKCGKALDVSMFHVYGADRTRVGKWCEPCFQLEKHRKNARAAKKANKAST